MFANAASVSAPRALWLCAVGALLGLGIAGYGLFTARGTTTRTVAAENIATVNQRPILRSDFLAQLEMETGKPLREATREEQLKVLDEMVREELLVQRALELDFGETDQNARNALTAAISDQAVAEVVSSQPDERQLRDYYAQHPEMWSSEGTMSLRNFLLAAPGGDAAAIAARLRSGTRPETLLAANVIREAPRQVDEYYFALDVRLGTALFAAVRDLGDGAVSEPVTLPDGVHIVQVQKNTRPQRYSFEEARPQISSDYNAAAQARRMHDTLEFLRTRAKIQIATDFAGDYTP
jgi:PPIC-type PPIASE domain